MSEFTLVHWLMLAFVILFFGLCFRFGIKVLGVILAVLSAGPKIDEMNKRLMRIEEKLGLKE